MKRAIHLFKFRRALSKSLEKVEMRSKEAVALKMTEIDMEATKKQVQFTSGNADAKEEVAVLLGQMKILRWVLGGD